MEDSVIIVVLRFTARPEKRRRERMRVKTRSMEETVLCGMFTALIAAGAFIKINIPVQPFPMHFTMQLDRKSVV